ncbi:pyruvate formate-lyase 1-activating enzyme [archaeon]|nr:pyruvate formate-lyase 1-activating enzyme [archaeon]|tara:strand:- start:774 stop:1511 length:738 start_codon:yes stop_codon:yes gene_type:complete
MQEPTLNIHSIETFGTHEGPGIRLVLFLQGCPLKCIYCHNPDTQEIKKNQIITLTEIQKLLEKQKPYFSKEGGITFSGGEPLLQAKSLIPICQELKNQGYHITIDTAGSILNDSVRELLNYVDLVLLDIKHADKKKYQKITKGSYQNFQNFLDYCEQKKKSIWLRYVLMPSYTDNKEDIKLIGEKFKDYSYIQRVEILPYRRSGIEKYKQLKIDYAYENIGEPNNKKLQEAKNILKNYFTTVHIR